MRSLFAATTSGALKAFLSAALCFAFTSGFAIVSRLTVLTRKRRSGVKVSRSPWMRASRSSDVYEAQDSLSALLEACGSNLTENHLPILRAMAVAARDPFFAEVADKIEQVGEIEVWGEY